MPEPERLTHQRVYDGKVFDVLKVIRDPVDDRLRPDIRAHVASNRAGGYRRQEFAGGEFPGRASAATGATAASTSSSRSPPTSARTA